MHRNDCKENCIIGRRKCFCALINQRLLLEAQIALHDDALFEHSLLHIFKTKIFSFFPLYRLRPERTVRIVKIYPFDSLLFTRFFLFSTDPKSRFFSRHDRYRPEFSKLIGYPHPASSLIEMIFDGSHIGLTVDLHELLPCEGCAQRQCPPLPAGPASSVPHYDREVAAEK